MSKKWVGLIASVAMLGAGVAGAQTSMDQSKGAGGSGTSSSEQMGTGGSEQPKAGQTTTPAATLGANELSGRVVRADSKMVYLDHMGAIVALKIEPSTRFSEGLKSARNLKAGDEIRASFTVKNKIDNVATSIMPGGTGGAGGPGVIQEQNLPPSPGTGGSMDQGTKQGTTGGQSGSSGGINQQGPLNDQGTGVGGSNAGGSGSSSGSSGGY